MMTTAVAHPNIALVKYWGKQDKAGNLPATPNLSITLSQLTTTTSLSDAEADAFWLNDAKVKDQKVIDFMHLLRTRFDIPPLEIKTHNNFPTGAGVASSASGFAALITAINEHVGLKLTKEERSEWARQGSASAARSIQGGFVALIPPQWRAEAIADASHWPLETVVAITSEARKAVSSTEGMQRSKRTSAFYKQWVNTSTEDFTRGYEAVMQRDFAALTEVAETSCLKMHSVMLTSIPTLSYWNPATMACMDAVRDLRANNVDVFFTIDAGPQVKAVCLPEHAHHVEKTLASVPGVVRTLTSSLGAGARIIEH